MNQTNNKPIHSTQVTLAGGSHTAKCPACGSRLFDRSDKVLPLDLHSSESADISIKCWKCKRIAYFQLTA